MTEELSNYTSRAVRALVLLHEKHLWQCLEVWKQAKAKDIKLPVTGEEKYQSLENLLQHILDLGPSTARLCKRLGLPDPEIRDVPNIDTIEVEADSYVEYVLACWRLTLVTVPDEKLEPTTYAPGETRWWIDGMLEHYVMHPIRHEFQLKELMQPTRDLSNYAARGVRALVLLHDKHLRQFIEVWKRAKAVNLQLPVTGEEKYQSLENLLSHILDSAGRYMMGMCKYLGLPDPEIRPVPDVRGIEAEVDSYVDYLLERWRLPLANVPDEQTEPTIYVAGETHYWIDVMLEHAVMHLIRHEFQLRELMQQIEELGNYTSRAARALVLLHEKQLRQCVVVWKQAKTAEIRLPQTDNKNYESMETLLRHILGAPRNYMLWICQQLKLPDPGLRPVPEVDTIEAEADDYLEHLLERWRLPLVQLEEEKLYNPEYPANGGTHHHCIDIMLEHALVHPIRHEFQLRELLERQTKS